MKRTCIFITALLSLAALVMPSCSKDRTPASIKPADVSFPGMQMRPGKSESTFTLIGRVRNKSARNTITEVTLKMTMEDVLVSGAATTVGAATVVLRKEVPPAESRDFEETVVFGHLPTPRGRLEWNYSVIEVKGK